MKAMAHKIGAGAYVVWGLLHIMAANNLYQLAAGIEAGVVHARMVQAAFHLLFFAVATIWVATRYNWHNKRLGFRLNLVMVSATDIGFIGLLLMPGLVPLWPGILGPVFWLLGLGFTWIGIQQRTD